MDFMDLLHYLKNSKDVLFWLVIFGKLIENVIDKKLFWKIWEPCEYIRYFKGFYETTWKWTVFWFHVNCELSVFLLLGRNMWLSGDYLARCRSLCDIGILSPHLCCGLMSSWHNWCFRGIIDVFVSYIMSLWRLVMWPWVEFSGFKRVFW